MEVFNSIKAGLEGKPYKAFVEHLPGALHNPRDPLRSPRMLTRFDRCPPRRAAPRLRRRSRRPQAGEGPGRVRARATVSIAAQATLTDVSPSPSLPSSFAWIYEKINAFFAEVL